MVFQEQSNGNEVTWPFNGRIQATDINANNSVISDVVSAASANVQGTITANVINIQQSAQLPAVRMDINSATFTRMARFLDPSDANRVCNLNNRWDTMASYSDCAFRTVGELWVNSNAFINGRLEAKSVRSNSQVLM